MDIKMNGIFVTEKSTGILIKSEKPLYVLANRSNFIFEYVTEFDNHYLNNEEIERIIIEEDGITVISSVEIINNKFYTNISILINENLDNLTLMNIYRTIIETIATVSWDANAINIDELDNELGNYYNIVFIACTGKSDVELPFDISLFYQIKDLVGTSLRKSLINLGYSKIV